MLNIFFGDMPDAIYNTSIYFKNTYRDRWITSDFAKKVIADVDKSTVISENLIQSPVLGPIPPEKLSGGTKTLLLIAFDKDNVFNASTCGDNCAKWILELAKERKVVINLRHIMDFGEDFKIKIMNTGKIVKNATDYIKEAGRLV